MSSSAERQRQITRENLREILVNAQKHDPHDQRYSFVYLEVIDHVGMTFYIRLFTIVNGRPWKLTAHVAETCSLRYSEKREAIAIDAYGVRLAFFIEQQMKNALGMHGVSVNQF